MQLGGAFNQDKPQSNTTLYTVSNNYKTMQYLWLHKDFSDQFKGSFLFLNNGQQVMRLDTAQNIESKVNFSQTVGTYLVYKKGDWKFSGSAYYQTGLAPDWADPSLAAYNVGLDVAYKLNKKWTAVVGYEILSGTSQTDTANTDNNSFNPFFGTNHKFNGGNGLLLCR